MVKGNFSEDFKRDAVSQRLGVSTHSLYAWKREYAKASGSVDADQSTEIRRLKRELARVTEERDILN